MRQNYDFLNNRDIISDFLGQKSQYTLSYSSFRLVNTFDYNRKIRKSGSPLVVIHLQFGDHITNIDKSEKMDGE